MTYGISKHIEISGEYRDKLLRGEKRATIRVGRVPGARPGKVVYIHCGGYVYGKVRITNVRTKRVRDLTDEDAKLDGFENREELLKALRDHYPNLRDDDIVTIIEFKWVERFDEPILSEHLPYEGHDPIKIAKLALEEDIPMSPRDRELLELLVECGSIRKAAKALGGLGKRDVIRRAVRKAFRLLKSRGALKGR
ncbi:MULTISPECIES: ASCH domain-containing protein [unclassified Methanopyrus]|uniref:ASCH domain-containing protein n=1 Tax=unclassified Methanopyrus TaxID=2684913 RepID=UPI000B4AB4E5|nr:MULTISPECIES: ASCH domain-containing protein [unclassified Methanopyrus]